MYTKHAVLVAIMGTTLLVGCGGGDAYVQVQGTTTITTGMEMQDLQRALKEGAITQSEYDAAKKNMLRRKR